MKRSLKPRVVINLQEEKQKRLPLAEQQQQLVHETRTTFAKVAGANLLQIALQIAASLEIMTKDQMATMPSVLAGIATLTSVALLGVQFGYTEGRLKALSEEITKGGPDRATQRARELQEKTIGDSLNDFPVIAGELLLSIFPSGMIMYYADKLPKGNDNTPVVLQALVWCIVLGMFARQSQGEVRHHIEKTIGSMIESREFQNQLKKRAS